jgi:nucleoid-associated protein YgaU
MALSNPFAKLEKLTIIPYDENKDGAFSGTKKGDEYEVMYNPPTFSLTFGQDLAELTRANNLTTNANQSVSSSNGTLTIELLIDGTGASRSGGISGAAGIVGAIQAAKETFVKDKIKAFYDTTMKAVDKTHKPRFLKLIWGKGLQFACQLQTATVSYLLFNRNGTPLRATISATFKQTECISLDDKAFNQTALGFQSPDVTKLYTVLAGDTIYNIAKKEYESESYYLQIAEVNDLKNYRKLIPGTQLILPSVSNA